MNFFERLFKSRKKSPHKLPEFDVNAAVESIQKKEGTSEIEPGHLIYRKEYGIFTLHFDRDITRSGRISVFRGEEKIFTFSVFEKKGNYTVLKTAFEEVIRFLNSDQSIKDLPDNDQLKGFVNHS